MVSVCTCRPARGGRSCEHFGGYKTMTKYLYQEIRQYKNNDNVDDNDIEDNVDEKWIEKQ